MKARAKVQTETSIEFNLSEKEANALEALAAYGTDVFLDVFYTKLGRTYLQPHEEGIRTLFEKIRKELSHESDKLRRVRNHLDHIKDILK